MTKELETIKKPPQAIDIENVVLGAILIDTNYYDAFELLRPDMFYDNNNQLVFNAMVDLFNENKPVDMLTVSNLIKTKYKSKVDEVYIIKLTQTVSSSAHLEYHCRIVMQKFIQRQIIKTSYQAAKEAFKEEKDVFELIDDAYDNLNQISDIIVSNETTDINTLTEELLTEADKLHRGEITPGLPTPIKLMNNVMGGFRDDELIILAGRPGMGKTAYAVKAAWNLAKKEIPVAFFSLEMNKSKLLSRCWSIETGINNGKFYKDGLSRSEQTQIRKARNELGDIPLHIDDKDGNMNINDITIKAKKLKRDKDIKILFIDYLQLIGSSGQNKNMNREQEISKISRGLKLLAKALNIPVVCLSQLSRTCEQRGGDKRPILSDLRESGAIEQDADVVGFFYRPEYYNIDYWEDIEKDKYYNGESTTDEAEYIIAKNRNGALGRNRMKFKKATTNFLDLDDTSRDEDDEDDPFIINQNNWNGEDMPY